MTYASTERRRDAALWHTAETTPSIPAVGPAPSWSLQQARDEFTAAWRQLIAASGARSNLDRPERERVTQLWSSLHEVREVGGVFVVQFNGQGYDNARGLQAAVDAAIAGRA